MKKLAGQIRRCERYKEWRKCVLKRDNAFDIKYIQVHHLKPFLKILEDNKIKTMDDALKCKELWDLDNGVSIKRGEHHVLTLIERMKYHTSGFSTALRIVLEELELKSDKEFFIQ